MTAFRLDVVAAPDEFSEGGVAHERWWQQGAECPLQLLGRGKALTRLGRERSGDDSIDAWKIERWVARRRRGPGLQLLERRRACNEELPEQHPQRVDVAAAVGSLAREDLRCGVARSPDERAWRSQSRIRSGSSDAEIDETDLAGESHHHIVGRDVSMDDPSYTVSVRERSSDLANDVDHYRRRDGLAAAERAGSELCEGAALNVLLRDERLFVHAVRRERLSDSAVRQRPDEVGFALKARESLWVRQGIGVQAFNDAELLRPRPTGEGQEHGPHPAASQRPNEDVGAPAPGILNHQLGRSTVRARRHAGAKPARSSCDIRGAVRGSKNTGAGDLAAAQHTRSLVPLNCVEIERGRAARRQRINENAPPGSRSHLTRPVVRHGGVADAEGGAIQENTATLAAVDHDGVDHQSSTGGTDALRCGRREAYSTKVGEPAGHIETGRCRARNDGGLLADERRHRVAGSLVGPSASIVHGASNDDQRLRIAEGQPNRIQRAVRTRGSSTSNYEGRLARRHCVLDVDRFGVRRAVPVDLGHADPRVARGTELRDALAVARAGGAGVRSRVADRLPAVAVAVRAREALDATSLRADRRV